MAELANNGTLFLDEIGELPLGLQAKLLQLVQEKTFLPIGGKELKHVDIRILTATNRNLETLVKEKKFREDLYFRLNVIEVTVPPLREDIPLLISYFLSNLNAKYKAYTTIAPEAVKILEDYHWPCNIRELEHVLERLVLIADDDVIGPDSLPVAIKKKKRSLSL